MQAYRALSTSGNQVARATPPSTTPTACNTKTLHTTMHRSDVEEKRSRPGAPPSHVITSMMSRAWDTKAITPQRGGRSPSIVKNVTAACLTSCEEIPQPPRGVISDIRPVNQISKSSRPGFTTAGLRANVSLTQGHAYPGADTRTLADFCSAAICSVHVFCLSQ
ncbi:unnamed protein product [Pleuronectes platessa]|uniref:Uncharacterized protein n=1 Tax=Pleuronectes platessa TaxID=8262 RepID=A0A9N7UPZ7_PLEPL|nr:unnamed protein product [Pleuronectes platessa]